VVKKFLFQFAGALLALWLAIEFVPKVEFTGTFQIFILAGILLALINLFVRPVLSLIIFPLKILTLGLITLVLNMGFVWIVDIVLPGLKIIGIFPLFLTTLIVWFLALFAQRLERKCRRKIPE